MQYREKSFNEMYIALLHPCDMYKSIIILFIWLLIYTVNSRYAMTKYYTTIACSTTTTNVEHCPDIYSLKAPHSSTGVPSTGVPIVCFGGK